MPIQWRSYGILRPGARAKVRKDVKAEHALESFFSFLEGNKTH